MRRGLFALALAAAATAVPAAAFVNTPGPCVRRSARGSAACGLQMLDGEPQGLWLPGAGPRQDISDKVGVGRFTWTCCGVYY